MKRIFLRPIGVPVILYFLSGVTILVGLVTAIQVPLGALPLDSIRFADTPISMFAHGMSGALFGLLGPIQFGRVLARKYGRLHQILGRVFVVAGGFLSLSSLSLMWHFPSGPDVLLYYARLVFGIALGVALILSMVAIRARNIARHRNWMIRAYAIGMGATLVSNIFIPIYVITGEPPTGLAADVIFVGSWLACIVFAEALVRRLNQPRGAIA